MNWLGENHLRRARFGLAKHLVLILTSRKSRAGGLAARALDTLVLAWLLLACIDEHIAHTHKLLTVQLELGFHLDKFGNLSSFAELFHQLSLLIEILLEFFHLLLETHYQKSFLLVALSCLCDGCEGRIHAGSLLCLLDELVLLEEVFNGLFFAGHFCL